ISLRRPRVRIARRRLLENYFSGKRMDSAILLPETLRISAAKAEGLMERHEVLFYGSPYGLIPYTLRYTYPFSQTNYPKTLIIECLDEILEEILRQFRIAGYRRAYIMRARSRHLMRLEEELVRRLRELGVEVEELKDVRQLTARNE
ncbi:MAG: hypothetical protein DRN59_02725, partial [Thaumarchaeota archaeon]